MGFEAKVNDVSKAFALNDVASPNRHQESWDTQEFHECMEEQDARDASQQAEKEILELETRRWELEVQRRAEMEAMDKQCVDVFLESVKGCSWRQRVRTPIKGTNLYTKLIRPCRPVGTSVDVKDSSFGNLRNFLE